VEKSVTPVVKEIARAVREKGGQAEAKARENERENEKEREKMIASLEVLVQRYDDVESRVSESDRITEVADKKVQDAVNKLVSDSVSQIKTEPDKSALIFDDFTRRITLLGSDVEEEANQTAALITEHRDITESQKALSTDAVEMHATIARIEETHSRIDATQRSQAAEIERIRAYLAGLDATSPASPVSLDGLVATVKSNVQAVVAERLRENTESLTAGVEAALRQQQEILYPQLWQQLAPALRMVHHLHATWASGTLGGNSDKYIGQL